MRLVGDFLTDEEVGLSGASRIVPVEQLLQGGLHLFATEHCQALEPGEDELVPSEGALG